MQHQSETSNTVTKHDSIPKDSAAQHSPAQHGTAQFTDIHEGSRQHPHIAVVTDLELCMYICLPAAVHFEQGGQDSCPSSHRCKLVLLFLRKPARTLQHVHSLGMLLTPMQLGSQQSMEAQASFSSKGACTR